MVSRAPWSRFLLAVALGAALAIGVTTPARAHAELVSTDPADGAALSAAPQQIVFTFSEPLLPDFACFILPDQECGVDELPREIVGNTVTIPWSQSAPPGLWVISYRIVSQDGHEVRGNLSFSYDDPQPSPSPTTGSPSPSPSPTTPTPQPTSTDSSPSASPDSSPTGDAIASPSTEPVSDESGTTTGWLIAGIAVIVLAVIAIIGLVIRRRHG